MTRADRALMTALAALAMGANHASAQEPEYRLMEGWPEVPAGVERWGQTIGVEIDDRGYLWIFHRCFATNCVGERNEVAAVHRFDPSGRLVGGWGEGRFVWPHGFHLDAEGNLWTTDALGREGKGHTVGKFSPVGKPLMILGTPGVAGNGEQSFDGPSDVAVAPNGDVFVADGHGNDRIVKFTGDGRYLMEWGREGTGPGEFDEPHSLAFDSHGRLFVGDRLNQRIQVFDQEGRYLDEYPEIMASGIHITADDIIYVADYQLREGIVILDARDFSTIGFIPGTHPEGVTVDQFGNVYAGEVIPRDLKKFERLPRREEGDA